MNLNDLKMHLNDPSILLEKYEEKLSLFKIDTLGSNLTRSIYSIQSFDHISNRKDFKEVIEKLKIPMPGKSEYFILLDHFDEDTIINMSENSLKDLFVNSKNKINVNELIGEKF